MDVSKPLFTTIIDNGDGKVMANFMVSYFNAFKAHNVKPYRISDSSATRSGNRAACNFLESDYDIWINIDADIMFYPEAITSLLSHNEKLVFGVYPKKDEQRDPCWGTLKNEFPQENEKGLVEVRRCGRGFMLVQRELLEMLKEENGGPALRYHNHGRIEWDFFPALAVSGSMSARNSGRELLTEDWAFCEYVRSLGVPIYVDLKIKLAHEGGYVYQFKA